MKSALLYLVGLLAILGVAFARRSPPPPRAAAPLTTAASSTITARPSRTEDRSLAGVLLAERTVDVSARTTSVVQSVAVSAGDTVGAGQLLGKMDARAKVQELVAADAEAKAQADRARRRAELEAAKVISRADADAARYEAIEKGARLSAARIVVDDAALRAPFAGTVVARFVEPSQQVGAGEPLFRLVSPGTPRLRFGAPPADAARLRKGDAITFAVGADETARGHATIAHVAAEVDPSVELVVIDADVAPEDSDRRSGTPVRVFVAPPPPAGDPSDSSGGPNRDRSLP